MKFLSDLLELIALLIILPFVLLFRLVVFLLLTAWLWAIPVALLIWAIK